LLSLVIDKDLNELHAKEAGATAESLLRSVLDANTSAMCSTLRKIIKPPRPGVGAVLDVHGKLAANYLEVRNAFFEHFVDILGASGMSFDKLVARSRNSASAQTPGDDIDVGGFAFPRFSDFVSIFSSMQMYKGVGEDLIGSELAKMCPHEFACLFYPVFFKSAVHVAAPIQWKGGQIQEIFKGKGSELVLGSYRDVMLAGIGSKAYTRDMRIKANASVDKIALDTQFGSGFWGASTQYAHIMLRAFQDVAAAEKVCMATIFTDVSTAFASMSRFAAIGMPEYEGQLVAKLIQLGFDPQEVEQVLAIVSADNPIDALPPHLVAMIKDMHRFNWFSVEGVSSVGEIASGSMAGTALGDIVFSMLMAKVLGKIRDRMLIHDVAWCYATNMIESIFGVKLPGETGTVQDVSFVDDCAFPILCAASGMMDKIKCALSIVYCTFAEHGLEINLGKGRTEIVIMYYGPGSKLFRSQVEHDLGMQISFQGIGGSTCSVAVVDCYKHLGTKSSMHRSMMPEIKSRMGAMIDVCSRIRHKFLRNRAIPHKTQCNIIQSLMLSRGLFQAGTWPKLAAAEVKKVHSSVMSVYRNLNRDQYSCEYESDSSLLSRMGLVAPRNLVRMQRILLLCQLARKPAMPVLAVLAAASRHPSSWVHTVTEDLNWFAGKDPFFNESSDEPFGYWFQKCSQNIRMFKDKCWLICKKPEHNVLESWARSKAELDIESVHACQICQKFFKSRQALSVHNHKVHGIVRHLRKFVSGCTCCACMQYFHTCERLLNHLTDRSERCRYYYEQFVVPFSTTVDADACAKAHDETRALCCEGWRRNKAKQLAFRVAGPLTLEAEFCGIDHKTGLKSQW